MHHKGIKVLFTPIVNLKTIAERTFFYNDMEKVEQMPRGGGVLPYIGHIGMCRWEGNGFQAVYSSIGYINQSIWV